MGIVWVWLRTDGVVVVGLLGVVVGRGVVVEIGRLLPGVERGWLLIV